MNTKIVAVCNFKGGAAKTTSTACLGFAFARLGYRVLLIDNDPQGSLSKWFGINDTEDGLYHTYVNKAALPVVDLDKENKDTKNDLRNLYLVPSSLRVGSAESEVKGVSGFFRLRNAIESLQKTRDDKFDFIFIDCAPAVHFFTNNALIAATDLVVPSYAEFLSVKEIQKTLTEHREVVSTDANPDLTWLGILFTRVKNRSVSANSIITEHRQKYKSKVFTTFIRESVDLQKASQNGQNIYSYDAKAHGATDYLKLTKEMLELWGIDTN